MTSVALEADDKPSSGPLLWRVVGLFPILLFVLVRQFFSNLLGVNRDALTLLLLIGLSALGVAGFLERLKQGGSQFLLADAVTVLQAFVAGIGILAYSVFARISAAEAVSSLYYYCLAPFLIYAGFLLCRLRSVTTRAGLIAAALAYAVTLGLGIAQLLGVDSPLLEYERGFIQLTSEGFARANGLYGTQIDFGCLSFFVFTVAFYINRRRGSWFAKITMALALLGALASMSRVAAAAFGVLFVVEFLFRGSFRDRLKHLVALSLVAAALYPLSEIIGATSTLMSEDPYAQDSTQGHLAYYVTLPRLLIQLYPIVGTGPGSQNGPGGPDGKIATDCLWLGFLVDFGAVTGAILVLFRVILLAYLLYRAYRFRSGLTVRITTVLTLMFLLASFVNSAFAYPVTVSIFYIIAGIFLYEDQVNQVRTACQFA